MSQERAVRSTIMLYVMNVENLNEAEALLNNCPP